MSSARPGVAGRSRRNNMAASKGSIPTATSASTSTQLPLSRRARKEAESAQLAAQGLAQPRTLTKVPPLTARRPAVSPAPTRPSLESRSASQMSNGSISSNQMPSRMPEPTPLSMSYAANMSTRPRNVLRRKQSSISREAGALQNLSTVSSHRSNSSSSIPRSSTSQDSTHLQNEVEEPAMSAQPSVPRPSRLITALPAQVYPELDRYRNIAPPQTTYQQDNLFSADFPAPPTPLFSATGSSVSGISGSPSTRFSGSPGPGPYSRDTTPTSMSSQSPGLVAPLRGYAAKSKQNSPASTRPPVSRRRAGSMPNEAAALSPDRQGLVAVRESLTSSSSNSTVRDGEKRDRNGNKVGLGLPPPLSPPPRKSSQKFKKVAAKDESPSKASRARSSSAAATSTSAAAVTTSPRSRLPSKPPRTVDNDMSMIFPPRRPSRDDTPELPYLATMPMPVVQSNMSSIPSASKRSSLSGVIGALPRSITPTPTTGSLDLPRPRITREATPAPGAATITKPSLLAPSPSISRGPSSQLPRAPSPSVSNSFKTRFPLFGRRKAATDAPAPVAVLQPEAKPVRKGPAAGTGHEGYGRLGAVRRRSNSTNNVLRSIPGTMSSSQESVNLGNDQFFADRMAPVVIAGGEIIENRNPSSDISRTDSNQSLSLPRPSFGSSHGSQTSLTSQSDTRNTLWPSAFPKKSALALSLRSRRPSDSSDSDGLAMKSTLALRRSAQRNNKDETSMRVPTKIAVGRELRSPSLSGNESGLRSDDSVAPGKKMPKRAESPRKWNLFGRSRSRTPGTRKQSDASIEQVQALDTAPKPVAFYALVDSSEQEDGDLADVEKILREAQVIGTRSPSLLSPAEVPRERKPSVSSSSASAAAAHVIESEAEPASQTTEAAAPIGAAISVPFEIAQAPSYGRQAPVKVLARPSRLPQVGRIPKVISARPDEASPKSFSRPFAGLDEQTSPAEPVVQNSTGADILKQQITDVNNTVEDDATPLDDLIRPPEFFGFARSDSPRGTTTTTGSSSSGLLSYADATAVIPEPGAPLVEDEIWDEYNDMFGDELPKVPPSAGSSQGKPFHLEGWRHKIRPEPKVAILNSPAIDVDGDAFLPPPSRRALRIAPPSSVYSADMTGRIGDMLYPSGPPLTPFSVTDFVTAYGERGLSTADIVLPASKLAEVESASFVSTDKTAVRTSSSTSSSVASEDSSPMSQVNLRVGSMTVSKWLTFGHVLFSPVRDDLLPIVGSLKRHSVLVLDGLGNDDWSFYAAETYPAATFFNLSPRAPLPEDRRTSSAFPLSPPNHHQIQFDNYLDKLPFASQSFTSVVFRFPAAAPEAHYRNIVSEARRVMKPGGYMEMSILDVDMNNMGTRTRRAVRKLKTQIHGRSADVSLGSTADLMQRLLGKYTFMDVKTCRVGVPVANIVASASGTNSPSKLQAIKNDDRSLPEMINDSSPVADESITRMVAKVGRWWYHRCYETATADRTSDPIHSMWHDKKLLAECEAWKTSLKLMVCHARVPEGIARVASI